jgi:hypothetical protein
VAQNIGLFDSMPLHEPSDILDQGVKAEIRAVWRITVVPKIQHKNGPFPRQKFSDSLPIDGGPKNAVQND